ncbi:ATP/GTP-binding protein [Candidatus Nitrosotenuis sp. DW1]|uniref:PRK13768 family protein n=1 Tax=Candidatus Nitrosotenuis sp. DW1 TaxID=2259672 RepID=UPI0015C7F9C5|nr:ATP/GTP-binding protein [Candidatus Nitrosotenuis sp. DW1]QLH09794.1 GTPase [Candidatus Nitrosotenuis sp. DW1]
MKAIFVAGTAGAGKSSLTSKIHEYYTRNGAFTAILNLDPGVISLPYTPDIDIRDSVDIVSIMKQYDLGPNGALVMASDLIASKIDEIQQQADNINPEYLIIDTPGQIELFAYRTSGPYFVKNFNADEKVSLFLYDGVLITTAVNFVSMALLATSIKLRMNIPTINVLTKTDLIADKISEVLKWTTNVKTLEDTISLESDGETYVLVTNLLRSLNIGGFAQGLIPVSNVTGEGMINLEGALSRILNQGEDVEN